MNSNLNIDEKAETNKVVEPIPLLSVHVHVHSTEYMYLKKVYLKSLNIYIKKFDPHEQELI